MKRCSRCKILKPTSDFYRQNDRSTMSACKVCHRAGVKARRNPEKHWASTIKRLYGLSAVEYYTMAILQQHRCACCRSEAPEGADALRWMVVDHDHETGQVRGLLCGSCNLMLGHAGDSPIRLRSGAKYLIRHSPLVAVTREES